MSFLLHRNSGLWKTWRFWPPASLKSPGGSVKAKHFRKKKKKAFWLGIFLGWAKFRSPEATTALSELLGDLATWRQVMIFEERSLGISQHLKSRSKHILNYEPVWLNQGIDSMRNLAGAVLLWQSWSTKLSHYLQNSRELSAPFAPFLQSSLAPTMAWFLQ